VAIRYPRGEAIGVPLTAGFPEIPLGSWELLRSGKDVALIGCGPVVHACLLAAEEVQGVDGLVCTVVNGRVVKPMDRQMRGDVGRHSGRIITFEESSSIGGFGSGVMEVLSEEEIVVPVKRVGLPDRFLSHASPKVLRQQVGLDKDGIRKTVRQWLGRE
jgi:1-deoxy-D-xylulose-5-phosphate synthase